MEPDNNPWDEVAARAARVGPSHPAGLSLDTLLAYRSGALDEVETERVEAALAQDPEARALLADLSAEPSAFLRRWAAQQVRPVARGRWLAGGAVGLVAAAALVMVFLRPSAMPPTYLLETVRGGQAEVRGPDSTEAPVRIVLDDEGVLTLVLRPASPLAAPPPAVRAFIRVGEERRPAPPAALQPGEDGAFRFQASAKNLFERGAGLYVVELAYAAEDGKLAGLEAERPSESGAQPGVAWLQVEIDYRPRREE